MLDFLLFVLLLALLALLAGGTAVGGSSAGRVRQRRVSSFGIAPCRPDLLQQVGNNPLKQVGNKHPERRG